MDYTARIAKARRKNPDIIQPGAIDCCLQHDDWCKQLKGEGECNCTPDITLTTKEGKFSVSSKCQLKKLGPWAERIPTIYDPRRNP